MKTWYPDFKVLGKIHVNKNNSQTELTHHVKLIANAKIAIKWFCYNCISMEWWYNTIKVIYIMIHWVIFLVCIKSLLSNQAPNILSVEVEKELAPNHFDQWEHRIYFKWPTQAKKLNRCPSDDDGPHCKLKFQAWKKIHIAPKVKWFHWR